MMVHSSSLGVHHHQQQHRPLSSRSPVVSCRRASSSSSSSSRSRGRPSPSRAAASAPEAAPPITREEMIAYIASGCKPKAEWRIGTEHEKFGFNLKDTTPIDYAQIKHLLDEIGERFEWEPIMEKENIIGLKRSDGQSITLEPGGQFELSGAPLRTIHETCAEVNSHLYQVRNVAESMDVGFLGVGMNPRYSVDQTPVMPKGRYKLMKAYMPTVGTMGLDMMFRTATVQVNLDYESEPDCVSKFRISLALQPIATALFANSPFRDGKPTGFKSTRSHVWTDTDNARCGELPFVFDDNFGFERYVDYMIDVPMYFVYRPEKGGYVDALGMSFRDFMEGKLPCLPGERPTKQDWEDHLSVAFPEVRLKKFLEMRGADTGNWQSLCALPALWVGLLYDEAAQKQTLDYISDWTEEERHYLREECPRLALDTPFRDGTVRDVARDVLTIASRGLKNRRYKEVHFLDRLKNIVESGETGADRLLREYEERGDGNLDFIYQKYLF
ncbi:glutamate--cysteine ligase [Pycnococcus provasolii]|uniref:Glutamate--cysteine ligase n=1 Tax=Pycnococcus provasolii TaxID=41880 RepID=A0A830HYV2_9CHLO|nr:glutamate--cysteine ligase [Pycnococcus provasolii]